MALITSTKDLADLCTHWHSENYITVDTEFVRTRTFYAQLCLIQVGWSKGAVAIDVLANGLDLAPLMEVMKNRKVIKVFHAARQDIEIFYQIAEVIPAPLFDSQIAAMVCGFGESVGYETLVNGITGHSLDKSQRFTDWSHRPLHKNQLEYAIGDVTHLRKIYEHFRAKLEKNGRSEWLDEEMKVLTSPETYQFPPELAWRRIRVKSTNRRFLARVQALAALRESEAQTRDVPRNRIMDDKMLLQLAANAPKNQKELDRALVRARPLRDNKLAAGVLKAIKKAENLPENALPKSGAPRQNGRLPEGTVELLKVLLKHQCAEAHVATKLVATVSDLEEFARQGNGQKGNGKAVAFTKGWRYALFGKTATDLIKGNVALSSGPRGLKIISTKKEKS